MAFLTLPPLLTGLVQFSAGRNWVARVIFRGDLQMAACLTVAVLVVLWVLVFRSPVGGYHTLSRAWNDHFPDLGLGSVALWS